jgi:hypothetical protein
MRLNASKQDYRQLVAMIVGEPPKFETILETLAPLEKQINR